MAWCEGETTSANLLLGARINFAQSISSEISFKLLWTTWLSCRNGHWRNGQGEVIYISSLPFQAVRQDQRCAVREEKVLISPWYT